MYYIDLLVIYLPYELIRTNKDMATKDVIVELGSSGMSLFQALKYVINGKINAGNTAIQIVKAGIGSIFIVTITAAFIGLAMSTQISKVMHEQFGAENFVGGIIALAIVRELAPVIASIVVAGRVGASITAEIGSMKVSEQVDALSVLGIDPIRYLLVPRLAAAAIISPLLTVLAAVIAILSGMVLAGITVDLSYSVYLDSVRQFLEVRDVFIMLLKALIFGCTIAIIATTRGFHTGQGAEAVGCSTTQTVVWSIILIFTFNYIITSIFFGF